MTHGTSPPANATARDIGARAARQRMTAEEREIEARAVLDSLRKHIALLDGQGNIVSVNRAWREFGLANGATPAQADAVGQNYIVACQPPGQVPGDAQAAAAQAGIQAVLAGTSPGFELEYPCHSPAEERWFLMRVTPLAGPIGGAVVTHETITERRHLEQQRAGLVAELQAANRELSDFAYVVSHDLKAPLRGISSLASWLIEDFSDKLGAEGRSHLQLIASRVTRLSALIDAILAYSRAGRSRDDHATVALGPLVQNVIDLLAPPPHIQVDVLGDLPALTIDPAKAQQVFQNLLSNAIDFMDKAVGQVAVACVRDGADWHFTVADNGPGIEARHFERVFQLFQTLASRDELERTGVGLALVKKIVEMEGGRVWIESIVGAGATFHFTLPPATPPNDANAQQEGQMS
jgi:signal transduction histidine kinase